VALQGFGNVGSYSGLYLHRLGGKVVAVTDVFGGIYNKDGIDVEKLMEHVKKTGSVVNFLAPRPLIMNNCSAWMLTYWRYVLLRTRSQLITR